MHQIFLFDPKSLLHPHDLYPPNVQPIPKTQAQLSHVLQAVATVDS